jgi:CBS domain-containing protein
MPTFLCALRMTPTACCSSKLWINSMAARRTRERWSCCAQLRLEMLPPKGRQEGSKTMAVSSGAGGMYGFLTCTAGQYMTPTVITVERQTTIRQLGALFEKHDFNAFPVMEDGKVAGLVTKFDFLRTFAFTSSQMVPHYNELMRRFAADVMTEAVVHVDPTMPLPRVLQLMVSLKMRSFPVITSDRQLKGMISREDVMHALRQTTAEV